MTLTSTLMTTMTSSTTLIRKTKSTRTMKIGSRHILFMNSTRGNYGIMHGRYVSKYRDNSSPNSAYRLIRKGLNSKIRHNFKKEIKNILQENIEDNLE